jgi:hypothetical protein
MIHRHRLQDYLESSPCPVLYCETNKSPSPSLSSHSNIVSRLIVSFKFALEDRISYTHNKHFTTDIGNGRNKSRNTGLTTDSFDPDQHCNCQERGWIRHHPRHQDVDLPLVWWWVSQWDVGHARFPRISVMVCQFLSIPATSVTVE